MKAITTRYHGPTDKRGSRITASDSDNNRVTVPYTYDDDYEMHKRAAVALIEKMKWPWIRIVGGHTKDGMVWVFVDDSEIVRAVRECLPDLKHYASMHGPGPDRRLAELQAALGEAK